MYYNHLSVNCLQQYLSNRYILPNQKKKKEKRIYFEKEEEEEVEGNFSRIRSEMNGEDG